MRLTPSEKLIIVMLADIQAALKIDSGYEPEFLKKMVLGGHSWALTWDNQGFDVEDDKPEVIDETSDILQMWEVLEHSIGDLDPKERAEFDAYAPHARYNGFDANHDPHFSVAGVLIQDLERFATRKGVNVNSHSSASLPRYRTLLKRYKSVTGAGHFDLGLDELKKICAPSGSSA